jgi:hypothetical protein
MVILVWLGGVSALLAKRKTLSLDELCALAWNGTQTNRPDVRTLIQSTVCTLRTRVT